MNRSLKVWIVAVTLLVSPLASHAQSWSTDFGAPPAGKGLNWNVGAMLEYQGRLIVTGGFTQAGALAVNRIAAWDGTQWGALGGGLPGNGEALTEYEGDLIAAGGGPPTVLMRWNGSSWSAIPAPQGTTQLFYDVCSFDGSIFVGTFEGGVSKLAWWNGASWSSVPLPVNAQYPDAEIQAMTVYNGQLFMTGGGPWGDGGFLFSWDGQAFGGPGWVFSTVGLSEHVYHELLYVGGDWYPEPPFDGVAIWDQNAWIPFGPGPGGVWDMATYHGRIVMGGSGVTSFSGITYNGQNEQFLGGGCSNTMWVFAVKEFQGDLYVAGLFDEICTQNEKVLASNFAKWSEPATAVSNRPPVAGNLRVESAPNPFNPAVTLTINVPARSEVGIAICDPTGRVVRRLASGVQNAGPYRVAWDGTGDRGEKLASGVYFARVSAGRETANAKLVLLK